MVVTAGAVVPPGRTVRPAGRTYPVVLPTRRDPRLQLAAVIVSLQVLGQTVLDFDLSIAQILVSLATCFVLEAVVTLWRDGVVAWPASALLTGNGVAFILRVPGTEHGDWWSLRGAHVFAAVAAVSLLSKYVVRFHGRHVFNPSNIGLVACFLVLGSERSDPQDLWWGSWSPGLALTLTIIVVGGLLIVSRLRLLAVAIGFWVTFAGGVALIAVAGHCITARWHVGPVCGADYWRLLVFSPEILVFLFFMITDPRTTPAGSVARAVHGAAVGVLAAVLVAPMTTEFATKVAVLAALSVVCAGRFIVERLLPEAGGERDRLRVWARSAVGTGRRAAAATMALVVLGTGLVVVGGRNAPASLLSVQGDGRPEVDVRPEDLPPVRIAPEVDDVDGGIDSRAAGRIAVDLYADLVIEAEAVTIGDADMAATAAVGPRLEQLEEALGALAAGGTAVIERYSFEELTLVIDRDGDGPQALPRLALHVVGTLDRSSIGGSPPTTVGGAEGVPVDRTFVLERVGRHHLVADVRET